MQLGALKRRATCAVFLLCISTHAAFAQRSVARAVVPNAGPEIDVLQPTPVMEHLQGLRDSIGEMFRVPGEQPNPGAGFNEEGFSCDVPLWEHRTSVFVDAIVLRPGNMDLIYSLEETGNQAFTTGPVAALRPDSNTGVRFGFNWALSEYVSLRSTYSFFETDDTSSLTAGQGRELRSLLTHPNLLSGFPTDYVTDTAAAYDVKFQTFDLDYRRHWMGDCFTSLNYLVGLRYGHLEQQLIGNENTLVSGTLNTNTDVSFDGFGMRFGLEAERINPYFGLLLYARGAAGVIGGDVQTSYRQTGTSGATLVNNFDSFRLSPTLDASLGIGWQSSNGYLRVTVGYEAAVWSNLITTQDYLAAVPSGQFAGLSDTVTFTGLAVRLDWRR